ncbi:MAG: hypothetical protein IFK94_02160 [Acidobacteria bacterium]|uniref:Uncharacterized protein n=1 Tax=Candidatus Polarisedimenticola svalbardensis TaxID=2886004 RepID=A0A8J7C246_9BACT|nr:hypothetical protein [Candidatus Polarisedimenticola svalbardensis]
MFKRCLSVLLMVAGSLLATAATPAQTPPEDLPSLGWIDQESVPVLPVSLMARLTADWEEIEVEPGSYDWARISRRIDELKQAGALVSLCLDGSHPAYLAGGEAPTPLVEGSVEAWLRFVRDAVRRLGDRVAVYEVLDLPSGDGTRDGVPAEIYAYVLKQTALAIRAEAERTGIPIPAIAQGAVDSGRIDWQQELWRNESAPYVDIVPVRFGGGDGTAAGETIRKLIPESLAYPPAPALWARFESGIAGEGKPGRLALPLVALFNGAALAFTDLPADDAGKDTAIRWLAGTAATLAGGYAPAPMEATSLKYVEGEGDPEGGVVAKFFSDETFQALVVYELSAGGDQDRKAWLELPSSFVRNPYILDPVTGRRLRTTTADPPGGGPGRQVKITPADYPLLLEYQAGVATPGFELDTEELQVDRGRELSAQEIIARHQAVQQVQDDYIERWTAAARVDYHFKFAQGGSNIDVSIKSNYFWARGEEMEWEQTEYMVNGTRVPWKKFPEIPLIQPEKVITLPMDLTLDRTYRYRLAGRDRVQGREAWILAFEPEYPDPKQPLYRGRVWIDREKFVRLKVSLVQNNLEAPVLTNEERDLYSQVTSGDGRELWMMSTIHGQQVWTAGGRNFMVQREVFFESYDINPDPLTFLAARESAYRSVNQMLQDTDEGFRYLERQEDGTRTVKSEMDTSQLFAAAGLFKDNGLDNIVPLAGADYFDYDLFGKGIQANVFFAGVFLNATATDPDLFGSRVDLTLNLQGSALKFDDKVFDGDQELVAERIRTRRQGVSLQAGVPLGKFAKLNVIGRMGFVEYDQEDEAEAFRAGLPVGLEFVLPPDHTVSSASVEFIYNRRGYTFSAEQTRFRRSEWGAWGLYDPVAGEFIDPQTTVGPERYDRWEASVNKEWFLPKFQKIRAEITYLDGNDLDRFSQYETSFFGRTRLSGFSGSGVRFDQGRILRAGYSFNVLDILQLDATVQSAWVKNALLDDTSRNFTGAGLSLNTPGPWKTYFILNYGRAISADIPELDDQQEFMLTVLKLF